MSLPAGVLVRRQLWWVDPLNKSAGIAFDGSELVVAGMTELWRVEMDLMIPREALAGWQGWLAARSGRRNPVTLSPVNTPGDPWRPGASNLAFIFSGAGTGSGGSDFSADFNADFGGSGGSAWTLFDDDGETVIFGDLGSAIVKDGNIAGSRTLAITKVLRAADWLPGHLFGVSGRAYRVSTATLLSEDDVRITFEPALAVTVEDATVLDDAPEVRLALIDDRQGRVGPSYDVAETVTIELMERVA